MTNRIDTTDITVQRKAGLLVLTMTPRHAQLLAASIWLGDADHTDWLDNLADLLTTHAGPDGERTSESVGGDEQAPQHVTTDQEDVSGHGHGPGLARAARISTQGTSDLPRPAPDLLEFREAVAEAAFAEQLAAEICGAAEEAARQAMAAVALAAQKTRDSARQAAETRAAATARMAELVAATVVQTARALQAQSDHEAERVDRVASEAASLASAAVLPGTEQANGIKAATVASTIRAAAVARAEQTALAAAVVARAAATAAMEAAATAADAAMALELEVVDTATAVQAVATATARDVAAAAALAAETAARTW